MKRVILLLVILISGAVSGQEDETPAGHIAYIGDDYNVYTFTPATDEITALTDDADSTHHYQLPTWSTDGRLAFFCCDSRFQPELSMDVFVSDDGVGDPRLIYSAENETATYPYWSPQNCDMNSVCRDLAVLVSRPVEPFKVEVIRDLGEKSTSADIGTGAPFYFSWSPDGTQLLRHINYLQMDVYDVTENEVSLSIGLVGSDFPAPAWSPVDDRLLVASLNEGSFDAQLVVIENEELNVLVSDIQGSIAFNWSPDGAYIAYSLISDNSSTLFVIDAVSGETVATVENELIVSFFWSPDSQKIAYAAISTGPRGFNASYRQQDRIELDWMTLDVQHGESQYHTTFSPTDDMAYLLLFFNQFAQSHRLWSPDSRHLVYGEITASGEPRVSVLDITRTDAVPFSIARGVIGIWSYE